MADKKNNSKYVVLLIVFTILFFISMVICVKGFSSIATDIKFNSLRGRLESIERDEKMFGPDNIPGTIFLDKDWEEDFDYYWEFNDMYTEYIRGRYADDPSKSLEILKEYAGSCDNDLRRNTVEGYIETIESGR